LIGSAPAENVVEGKFKIQRFRIQRFNILVRFASTAEL